MEWSVRQGCPLSPLLYLIAANALSILLIEVGDQGRIKAVLVPENGEMVNHAQFVDDTSIITEASLEGFQNVLSTFRTFGDASGLYIKEEGIKETLI